MRYLALLQPGPAWLPGIPVTGQDRTVIVAHLKAMRRLYDAGALLFGGPFSDVFGGVAIVETKSRAEAMAMLDADPAVAAGLMTVRLHEVRAAFDVIAGTAWSPPHLEPA